MTALSIALKDLRLMLRDRMALFWVLGFPLIFALFFGAVLSGGLDGQTAALAVVVSDAQDSEQSRALVSELKQAKALAVSVREREAAQTAVRKGEAIAALHIPKDFGGGGALSLGLDPSRGVEAAVIEQSLNAILQRPASAQLSEGRRQAALPAVKIERVAVLRGPQRSAFDLVFPGAVMWGLIGCAAAFAVSMVAERSGGTLLRLRAAPIARSSILGGKALACALACLVSASVLVLVGWLALGVRIDDPARLGVALMSTVACFVGITTGLSVLGKSEQAVAGAGWSTLIVMAMLGGGMVPLSLMPEWLEGVSVVSPVRWGIVALEGAMWRGLSWRELLVPCAVLWGVGLLSFGGGLAMMRRGLQV